ncbi:mxaL protein [Rhodopseudomonas rhenobacensis]|uniref:MxaL protein n=1 Tax=Rhodopseudomonas rhenobacensis TaxID=87461 RepID=A0A7W7Z377_9BRAD|nr:vWA domain-containing protein [Rhodopseudomonas rhenobacensis]MBB5047141.1 mxaL protein [Rhodopseudomonas rhenobacensis]
MTLARFDSKAWLLVVALVAALAAALMPPLGLQQDVYDIVAVVDITGSMNTRDMGDVGRPLSRLAAARDGLEQLAAKLPCRSRIGLGVFTERRALLLFEPVPVCANFDAVTGAIRQLDWRMAWEGDSYIAKGLYSAIELGANLDADLLFFTDGHEAPPLAGGRVPEFDGKPGAVSGLIVGVGGDVKSSIPKFDDSGREIGAYRPHDVAQDNRHGLPPAGGEAVAGWHPRNAPFGAAAAIGDEHLSSLREPHLRELAELTGLGYRRLGSDRALLDAVHQTLRRRSLVEPTEIGVYPAAAALVLLAVLYGLLPLFSRAPSSRSKLT